MDLLTAAVLGRNWYWANNGKCDTLPVAGQTSIMGYTLASDGLLDASSLGLIDGVAQWELRTTVPYGDWFALTSAGTVLMALAQGGNLPLLVALPFVLGALAGMLAGRLTANRLAGPRLQTGFASVMLVVCLGMLWSAIPH